MHYHLEIVLPPTRSIVTAVRIIMAPFKEKDEHPYGFWDWYVIGGRWEGEKILQRVPKEKLDAFHEELKKRKITVSGVQFGKQTLEPASQIPEVDALWREMCPEGGDRCYLFRHATSPYENGYGPGEICRVDELPESYHASKVIIGGGYEGRALEMYETEYWDGATWNKTAFNGLVHNAIAASNEKNKMQVTDDWLVVTVDYHS